ncbi:MAG TPA: hypothetical protein VM146_16300 [Steroidobacteraceae bacterium]|nr:hypothetical protein [Steroidobacteraceae bacterium]
MLMFPVLFCTAVPAAAPHPCTSVQDDAERLACYDRTFGTPTAPKPQADPPAKPPEAVPEKFSAVVSKIEWRNGVFVLTLDNGQVWIQSERDSRVQIEAGETVSIRKASLGSFLLSSKQGLGARVRQLH